MFDFERGIEDGTGKADCGRRNQNHERTGAFDTPTITNVVATYPAMNSCLGLYNPQQANWYTDNHLRCLYPELGPRCGYAVTAVYGMVDPAFKRLEFKDILLGIAEAEGPVILLLKENFSEK